VKPTHLYGFWFTPTLLTALWLAAGAGAPAWGQNRPPADLTQASLEELADLQVTSVSKKEQSLSKAGAAVFVITQEDIRRSGMQNIPDLLRMAPGVDVARIDANTWAISIRGFNDRYSNKLLVLIVDVRCTAKIFRACSGISRTFLWKTSIASRSSADRAVRYGAPMP